MGQNKIFHPVDIQLGQKLRARRVELGLSQEELANAIGITFQQIQKYERGINRISASRLHDIANSMNIDIGYFFASSTYDFPQTSILEVGESNDNYIVTDKYEAEILSIVKSLSDSEKSKILDLLKDFLLSK